MCGVGWGTPHGLQQQAGRLQPSKDKKGAQRLTSTPACPLLLDSCRVQAQRERQIHARLRHDNIIQLLASFEDEDNIYFVLEYATGGDLFQLMRQATSNFTEREIVQDVLIPLLEALEYCHQNGIVHRDIKVSFLQDRACCLSSTSVRSATPCSALTSRFASLRSSQPENLLLTSMGELKLADFGLAIDVKEERPVTRLGTLDYMVS